MPIPPAMPDPKTTPTPSAAPEAAASAEPTITVGDFIENLSHSIPVAGLIADQPELLHAELTAADWQKRLDTYQKSERP